MHVNEREQEERATGPALGDCGVAEALVALEVEGAEAEDALLRRLVQPPPRLQLRTARACSGWRCGMIAQEPTAERACNLRTRVSGRESGSAESLKSSKGYGAMAEKGSKA